MRILIYYILILLFRTSASGGENINASVLSASVAATYEISEAIKANAEAGDSVKLYFGNITKAGITSAEAVVYLLSHDLSKVLRLGVCHSKSRQPTLSDSVTDLPADTAHTRVTLKNLEPGQFYLVRAFAVLKSDTIYSRTLAFYTHKETAVSDIDGNYYNQVKIGSQTWLAEDLKTTRLNDGTPILQARGDSLWGFTKEAAWCWYGNDSLNFAFPRGKMYNWYAVESGRLCPAGWHVPSDPEWKALVSELGGDSIAGAKLKTTGTLFWRDPNKKASNESGFSAIPSGERNSSGIFTYSSIFNNWWSSERLPGEGGSFWYVYHGTGYIYNEMSFKMYGYSVRCLKD